MNQEELIVPYNNSNILITIQDVLNILDKFNIKQNKDIIIDVYIQAFTHKSYIKSEYQIYHSNKLKQIKEEQYNDCLELRDVSYERLEFLGDTVIKMFVCRYLFLRYQDQDEGLLTRMKTKIENRKTLANFARLLNFGKFIIQSQQIELSGGRNSDKLLEDCFESFIGALSLDQGYQVCEQIILQLLETEIDYAEIQYKDCNYKDKLLRFFHQNNWQHPIYKDLKDEIKNNKKYFTVQVKNNLNDILGQAQDLSKKKAEQKAAMYALIKYNQLQPDQIINDFDI